LPAFFYFTVRLGVLGCNPIIDHREILLAITKVKRGGKAKLWWGKYVDIKKKREAEY
jgi:hypothetical protein